MKLTPFGKKIRMMRLELGISLKEMAKEMKLSSSYLSSIELGKRHITDRIIERYSDFFKAHGVRCWADLCALARESERYSFKRHGLTKEQLEKLSVFAKSLEL